MKLILASGNAHKAEELGKAFGDGPIELNAAPRALDVIEDGKTLHENALRKAEAYFKEFKVSTLADDSGLFVPARPEILGVETADFAGAGISTSQRNVEILKALEGLEDRKAYFSCVLCFYLSPEEIFYFEGRVQGRIAQEIHGEGGFGQDPLFIAQGPEQTLAEIPEWKEKNSHRAKALGQAIDFFNERVCQEGK